MSCCVALRPNDENDELRPLWHSAHVADTLAPGFIVASPLLRDSGFARAVVVLVEHGKDGSLGFIVNRPAPVSFGQVISALGLTDDGSGGPTPVFVGGPVTPSLGWILFDPADADAETLADAVEVSADLAVSASRELLAALARGAGPARRLLALGYAGWMAGQLDGEFQRGVWIPVDLDAEIVFDTPPEDRWRAALAGAGIDPARMSGKGVFSA